MRFLKLSFGVVVLFVVAVGVVAFLGPSLSLGQTVLHEESSEDSGVTYEYSGSPMSGKLQLVRVTRLTGTEHELRLGGPDAAHYYYPVELQFGTADPTIRDVRWQPDGVVVLLGSGNSIHVRADNFVSVR